MNFDVELAGLCVETKTNPYGIMALIRYYEKYLGWTEEEAVAHIIKLFEDGVIEQIKQL